MHLDIVIRFSLLVAPSRRIASREGCKWHAVLLATNWSGGMRRGTSKRFKKFLKSDISQWLIRRFRARSGGAATFSPDATVARQAGRG
jgi:hypothetical protein